MDARLVVRRLGQVATVVTVMVACGRLAFEPVDDVSGDAGADAAAESPAVVSRTIAAGSNHTCVASSTGTVQCWGAGAANGHGGVAIGDDETPSTVSELAIPNVAEVVAGASHTCVRFVDGNVRCWGYNGYGQLGIGTTSDELDAAAASNVQLGAPAIQLVAGANHNCVLLVDSSVRCWGFNDSGQLGNGTTNTVGDGELPSSIGTVLSNIVELAAGGSHTCARNTVGAVVCWGAGAVLGTGSGGTMLTAASATEIAMGEPAIELSAGYAHTCALLASGAIRCWGEGMYGQLGIGSTVTIGDDEPPTENVRLGAAVDIEAGGNHTCARLANGELHCWGSAAVGQLGYGNVSQITDPMGVGGVPLGRAVNLVALGANHTCVLVMGDDVFCWGLGNAGALGYGSINNVGDNETPASMGPVSYR